MEIHKFLNDEKNIIKNLQFKCSKLFIIRFEILILIVHLYILK
jgi:hypothetical protein